MSPEVTCRDVFLQALSPLSETALWVWSCNAKDLAYLTNGLSSAEVQQASRISHHHRRKQFMAARYLIRQIISVSLGIPPREVKIPLDRKKPLQLETGQSISYAHTGTQVVVGIAKEGAIGVDAEQLRLVPMKALIRRFFPVIEQNHWETLSEQEKKERFFQWWTGKEALVKAIGGALLPVLKSAVFQYPSGDILYKGRTWSTFYEVFPENLVVSLVTEKRCPTLDIFLVHD